MGIFDWMRGSSGEAVATEVAAVPALDLAREASVNLVTPALPGSGALAPVEGKSGPQAGFMDDTTGEQKSLTWARYQTPMFTAGYAPYFGVPGTEISRERAVAAAVTTDLLTSNSVIATLVENFTTYAIGTGLTLSSRPDHDALGISAEAARELSNRIERAWAQWAANPIECDASGRHTIHQLVSAGFRSWLLTGEFVFLLDWRAGGGARTRTKVKLLDSRQVDQSITRKIDGGSVLQGVQCDEQGRVVGYYIRPFVLGNFSAAPQPVFVRARTTWGRPRAVHLFDSLVPGQIRGLSPLIAALSPAHAKGTLQEFTLAAALVQSMTTTTVESDLPAGHALNAFVVNDGVQPPGAPTPETWGQTRAAHYSPEAWGKVSLEPGKISHLAAGDKLKMHRSETPNSTYDPFNKSLDRGAAKAAGGSYEDLTGDYSATSFSASRLAAELPWRINKRRRAFIAEPFYRNVFGAWLEEAIETGAIKLPDGAPEFWQARDAYTRAVWRGEGKPSPDPLKTAQADVLRLENGLATYEEILGENGKDFEETLAQRKAEKEQLEAAGFSYPTPKTQPGITVTAEPDDASK